MKLKPMQIMSVIVLGTLAVWVVSKIVDFYDPNAKGMTLYYSFFLFLIFSLGILDIHPPTILD